MRSGGGKRERSVSFDLDVLHHYGLIQCAQVVGKKHELNALAQMCLATDLYRALCCKKYVGADKQLELSMPAIVDEAWHEFILNTDLYAAFSNDFEFFCKHTTFSANDSPHLIEQRVMKTIEVAKELGFYFEGNWWPKQEHNPIQIFVKMLDGKTNAFDVQRNMTILELKRMIKDKSQICMEKQRIIFAGRQLDDKKCIGDYKEIANHVTLHLVLKVTGC